jgi:hypothetical protein
MSSQSLNDQAINQSAAPSLAHAVVGQQVWMDYFIAGGKHLSNTYPSEVKHVDKAGRLYISQPEYWGNWRYGFNRESGLAKGMQGYVMRIATPEQIEEYEAALRAKEEAREDKRINNLRTHALHEAAPELLDACVSVAAWFKHHHLHELGAQDRALLARVNAAITKAQLPQDS